MAKTKFAKSEKVKTPKFRAAFVNIFKPTKYNPEAAEKYSITMLFPKGTDLSALKAAARETAIAQWGSDDKKWPKKYINPFKDGDTMTNRSGMPYDGFEGCTVLRASSTSKPGAVDQNVEDIIDQSEFYAGCYAKATLICGAFDDGLTFYLQNVMKVDEGEPFVSSASAKEDFAPVASEKEASYAKETDDIFS